LIHDVIVCMIMMEERYKGGQERQKLRKKLSQANRRLCASQVTMKSSQTDLRPVLRHSGLGTKEAKTDLDIDQHRRRQTNPKP
jgi:hydroxyacyl-ACP dehydratase HTD2-like protein with hotdog domain